MALGLLQHEEDDSDEDSSWNSRIRRGCIRGECLMLSLGSACTSPGEIEAAKDFDEYASSPGPALQMCRGSESRINRAPV